jgi:cytosine/creatinine deaminase
VTGVLAGNSSTRDRTSFFLGLDHRIEALGGLFNAHLHIDRAETLDATLDLLGCSDLSGASAISLSGKHALIPMVHASSCYDPPKLEARVDDCIERLMALGTARADSVVDVTDDRVGFDALDRLLGIAARRSGSIDFRVGAYSPLGFRDDAPGRWALVEEAAIRADFVGALPERDDRQDYPDHIGFEESCRRFLDLAHRTGKSLHMHVDQRNHDAEAGAELVLRVSRDMGLARPDGAEPLIWLVHMISPSTYDEERFATLAEGLAEEGIGVICCPSAAISMRQIRPIASPTGNSIARVLELLAAGVHVRLGSDNVCDITSPAGTLDLRDELFVLAHALRFYDIGVLARLAAGQRLTREERARVVAHLAEDRREVTVAAARYHVMAGR